jgi:DNA-binding NtrC family response regulator
MARLLIVDDDRSIRRTLEKFLIGEGFEVATAQDAPGAIAAAEASDLMLLDLGLPGGSGFDVLAAVAERPRPPTVIVVTARDDMQSTVKAIQLGAYEYLVKPVDIDRLRLVIRRAIDSRDARATLTEFVSHAAAAHQVGNILGKSPAIRDVWKHIGAVSTTRAPVLITGESGTGKELVAKAIHYASDDRDRPFVAVNCTALAAGVLESELFGHVRGAFSGATGDRAGRFELAGRGTIFLDEIGEISPDLQAKLLRVLQERTFERVGDARPLALEARVIAATHRDLGQMVARGTFREDLYYRLRVVEVGLPPLRDRPDDIPILVEGLLAKVNRELHKAVRYVTPTALARLTAYPWPGNVRELENMLTRAVVLAKGEVLDESLLPLGAVAATDAPTSTSAATGPTAAGDDELPTLRELERRHIVRVLAHTGWNKRRSCAILDISRPTLDRKIEEFGLHREEPA